ncbi:MAG: DUF2750 domain-containing protein [Pseudomonadota bacterium]|nr:DUF2750 domain-containing protein [Gammaproteobacteria bacterium]MBU1628700.1 DUF2750 domain-containing protein [Gammaproteobacteria bacterium]MBU2546340.1 DUF2750 domain-containing protein [Gammaproteobacteria bacterium]
MKISKEEVAAVIQLPAPKRYDYFVKRVVGFGKVWGLYQEGKGWELSETNDGNSVFLLWPAKEYAELCIGEGRENSEPKAIELHDLLNDLIPHLRKQGLFPGVFFVPHVGSVNIDLDDLEQDLRTEISFYDCGWVRKEMNQSHVNTCLKTQNTNDQRSSVFTAESLESAAHLPAPKRYSFFVKWMVGAGKVWGLYREGWATVEGRDGRLIFPFWLDEKYAELCANQQWGQYKPRAITLEDVLDEFLPTLREKRNLIGMFFVPETKGITASLDDFESDLREEHSFYESGWIRKTLDQGNEYERENVQSIQLQKSLARWQEGQQGIEDLLQLSSDECYDLFITEAVQNKKVWGLYEKGNDEEEGGWVMSKVVDTGQATFPLWSARKYAKACARGDWVNAQPTAISLREVLDSLIPYLRKEGIKPGVSFILEKGSVRTTVDEVEHDLRKELSKTEKPDAGDE